MEEYKNKVIEIEKESQRLIEALKGLEDNAKALRDAKGDIQSTSAKIVEFLDPLKTVTQKISNITSASHNIINDNIENQERLESKLNNRIESQTKAIDSSRELVEENLRSQKEVGSKINEQLELQTRAIDSTKEIVEDNIKTQKEVESVINVRFERQTKAIESSRKLVEENIKGQKEGESKINERLDAQAETANIVGKKLNRVEVLAWIILAFLAITSISSLVAPKAPVNTTPMEVAPSAANHRIESPSRNIGLTSQQPDEYSGHIVCKGKIEGEKCNGGVLVKNESRGGFYGCENFNNGKGCRHTVDYPFICKGCKKYMVKRPKGRVTKNGKPVLIWGCPDYLETRAEKCEEYWDYK
jgi:hypothetical protein